MLDIFALFWTLMIFCSLYWYGFLLLYIAIKGGREIRALTRTLAERKNAGQQSGADSK
jgi:hypothetical protein